MNKQSSLINSTVLFIYTEVFSCDEAVRYLNFCFKIYSIVSFFKSMNELVNIIAFITSLTIS